MIPVASPIPEPTAFDASCRKRGVAWLVAQRLNGKIPKTLQYPNHWAEYENDLSVAFKERCGWWAMWIAEGQVEHFMSILNSPCLAYEWSNYRYVAGSVNSSKRNHDEKILDPFEIEEGWFEVILPSMQLIATDLMPGALADKSRFTLNELHLRDGKKVVRCRKRWYQEFKEGRLNFDGLERFAPLVAKAVKKMEDAGIPLP